MYFYTDILSDLRRIGVRRGDTLLVHSSMNAIGNVDGGAETVIDALMETVGDGILIFPTHTWATMNQEHATYDPKKEPACVGILPNLFMKRKNVYRSLHPTHSLAAWSQADEKIEDESMKKAYRFVSGEEKFTTPCNREGCYGKLYDQNAKILLLGVGLNKNTYMHGVEEWYGIKERLTEETLPLEIVMPDQSRKMVSMKKHFKPNDKSIAENYVKMYEPFKKRNVLHEDLIGDAKSMLLSAKNVAKVCNEYLDQDRDYFNYKPDEF